MANIKIIIFLIFLVAIIVVICLLRRKRTVEKFGQEKKVRFHLPSKCPEICKSISISADSIAEPEPELPDKPSVYSLENIKQKYATFLDHVEEHQLQKADMEKKSLPVEKEKINPFGKRMSEIYDHLVAKPVFPAKKISRIEEDEIIYESDALDPYGPANGVSSHYAYPFQDNFSV